jgi:hypothetical protein
LQVNPNNIIKAFELRKRLHFVHTVLSSEVYPDHFYVDYCLRPFGECGAKLGIYWVQRLYYW